MRINSGVLNDNMMRNLQKNMKKLDKLNQQLSSGKKFDNPSENPIGVADSMELSSLLSNHDQYLRNLGETKDWMASTESALKNSGKILQRAREQAVYGATDSLSKGDRKQIAAEIGELKDELINLANSKLGERYLFAGQKTNMDDKPFDDDGNYQGDSRGIKREVSPGDKMKINTDGKKVFEDAIANLEDLETALNDNDQESINDLLSDIDDSLNTNVEERATVGAKINRLDLAESKLDEEKIQSEELLSENEDVDIAKTITDLKMQENVYRSSLASGARIMQPTLVEFLQ
ncbi:MAG: flagellar hook-associated protein FlgL [Halanaerobiales bacterium]